MAATDLAEMLDRFGQKETSMTYGAAVDEPRIVDNPDERRYEAWLGDRLAGIAEYRIAGERVIFFHTEIDPAFEGHGVGSRLAAGALDDVRARGLRVTPKCPFIAAYVRRHPAYADLIAAPGAGRSA